MASNIIQFASELLKVDIKPDDITDVHPIKTQHQRNNVCIVRFNIPIARDKVIRARKQLNDRKIYINEHLTYKISKIFKEARCLRFLKKIKSCWTRNCKVIVKLNNDTVRSINSLHELS